MKGGINQDWLTLIVTGKEAWVRKSQDEPTHFERLSFISA